MGTGTELRDREGLGRYIRERILPLDPSPEPIPFRGRVDSSTESLPFFDEMDASLRATPGAIWNVLGPPGCGKSCFARWAAARWGKRFLDDPEGSPCVLWIHATRLKQSLLDDRALTGGPFAFALAADVEGQTPEDLARHLTKHPFIIIVDKDEDPTLADWKLELPMGLPPTLRLLHLAVKDSLGGPCVRLALWDRETALLAAHQRHGAEGVRRIEALEASPAAALVSYPPFVAWWLEREQIDDGARSKFEYFAEYLARVHREFPGEFQKLDDWCTHLLDDAASHPSLRFARRRLGLGGEAEEDSEPGRTLRAFLVAELFLLGKLECILDSRLLGKAELELLVGLELDPAICGKILERSLTHPFEIANAVNLYWKLARRSLPGGFALRGLRGVQLAGHAFRDGLVDVELQDSDLSAISLGKPLAKRSTFQVCTFREASLGGVEFQACKLVDCALELTDLSECVFESCEIKNLELTEAILSGARFHDVTFSAVAFGQTVEGEPQRFKKCVFERCDVSRLASSGLFLESCKMRETSFAGLSAPRLEAEGSTFEKCDFDGFAAAGAKLEKVELDRCILADVDLQGADLRKARLIRVDFQPGPASRAGHTDTLTRDDPMHGSKSGFYAQDLADGVYLDPDSMRTADLRNADLRGAVIEETDLFRVDLRGAKLDPGLREKARTMRAFVD
jgi:uncharacterized protein YjbI with pentapeptide repeats